MGPVLAKSSNRRCDALCLSGILFPGIGLFSVYGVAVSLYYLMHSTVVTAGFFRLADVTAARREQRRVAAIVAV
ncbi:MAG: hypothetical protein SWC40_05120 [Thermodesulfobacteriota bacterium]|nr:hypothetical protein [Thermodesulfobacteriota bacterium]